MALRWLPLLLVLAALLPGAGSAQALKGEVLSIGDGDTIRVRQGGRAITIRLACIDAPETAQSPWGQHARRYLQQRLSIGREVTLEVKTTDRYGRTVAEVISDININLVMVEDGQAFAYRRYLSGCNAKEYLDAEYRASRHRYGGRHHPPLGLPPWAQRCRDPGWHHPRRAALSLQGDQLLCPRPGATAAGAHLLDGNGDGQACESLKH